jgi:hypothetical protein
VSAANSSTQNYYRRLIYWLSKVGNQVSYLPGT